MARNQEQLAAELAQLLDAGDDVGAARLIASDLEEFEELEEEDRLRIAAEVVSWL